MSSSSSPTTTTPTKAPKRQPTRRIVLAALANGPGTSAELSERCGLPAVTVRASLTYLAGKGLVLGVRLNPSMPQTWELWSHIVARLKRGERRQWPKPAPALELVRSADTPQRGRRPTKFSNLGDVPHVGGVRISAEPFVRLLKTELALRQAAYDPEDNGLMLGPQAALARDLGMPARVLYRFLNWRDSNGNPTTVYGRNQVEDALTRLGVDFYGLYPEFVGERDIPLEPTRWCRRCREVTTPIQGVCPWCESVVPSVLLATLAA